MWPLGDVLGTPADRPLRNGLLVQLGGRYDLAESVGAAAESCVDDQRRQCEARERCRAATTFGIGSPVRV